MTEKAGSDRTMAAGVVELLAAAGQMAAAVYQSTGRVGGCRPCWTCRYYGSSRIR